MNRLIDNLRSERKDDEFRIHARYSPTVEHSESFAEATGDDNLFHRKHPVHGEAICPGFLQTSVALSLIEGAKSLGKITTEYPFSITDVDMSGFIITGRAYDLDVTLKKNGGPAILANAVFRNENGTEVCRIGKRIYQDAPVGLFLLKGLGTPVLDEEFFREQDRFDQFREVVDYGAVDSGLLKHLFAISGSSSSVFEAIRQEKLKCEKGIVGIYCGQKIHSDFSRLAHSQQNLKTELYVSNRDSFGVKSRSGEVVGMSVAGMYSGEPSYVVKSTLSFRNEKLLEGLLRKSVRATRPIL